MDDPTEDFDPTLEQAKHYFDMPVFDKAIVKATLIIAGVDIDRLEKKYAAKLAESN